LLPGAPTRLASMMTPHALRELDKTPFHQCSGASTLGMRGFDTFALK